MEKIAIMVDSGADISPEFAREKGVYYLPLYVNIGGEFLKDRIDISPDEFYSYIKKGGVQAKTSLPAPGDIMELVEEIKNDGYGKVIMICIGSHFSGTYNLCDMLEASGIETYAFDSRNITMAEGFLALFAKELIEQGKNFEEVKEALEKTRENSRVFFTLESLKYIIEGGRVPKTFGKLTDALNVKPLITVNPEEGKFKLMKIVRGEKRIFKQFHKIAKEYLKDAKNYYIFIGNGDSNDMADRLEETLKEFIDGASLFIKGQISPTLGANTGPGLFGFAFLKIS